MSHTRLPTMNSALDTLVGFGLKIDTVVDVGVRKGTGYLVRCFPEAFHLLFEPADAYDGEIASNYRSIRHELVHVAVSSDAGVAYQVDVAGKPGATTKRSLILDKPLPIGASHGGEHVTACKQVTKAMLDGWFAAHAAPANAYLVKIDVDGHEIPVIRGGRRTLGGADVVIVEATMTTLLERGAAIHSLGFQLFDIVDHCFYHDTLSQVDLVFVNNALRQRMPDLRPWETKQRSRGSWFGFSGKLQEMLKKG